MTTKRLGLIFIIGGIGTFLADKLTGLALSNAIGQAVCGASYNQPVDGILGDRSCGFNTDMHLVAVSMVALVIGLTLYAVGSRHAARSAS